VTKTGFIIINVLPDTYRTHNVARMRSMLDLPEITDIKFINGWTQGKDWLRNNYVDSKLLVGEMGAFASVVESWKYIVDKRYDEVLVFENDTFLKDGFMDLLNYYRSQVPNDFDAFSLCAAERDRPKYNEALDIEATDICRAYQNWPSNAVLYSNKGARKALKEFDKVGRLEHTIDVWLYEHSGLNIYTLKPTAKRLVGRYLGPSTCNPAWTGEGWPEIEW
jgi:GR25 family glycosyltransferase involved in LPS biosynthesis